MRRGTRRGDGTGPLTGPSALRDLLDVGGLPPAVAPRRDLELHSITLVEGAESFCLNCGVMHENVGPLGGLDEAVALFRVEPLDRADCHGVLLVPNRKTLQAQPVRAPSVDHATGITRLGNGQFAVTGTARCSVPACALRSFGRMHFTHTAHDVRYKESTRYVINRKTGTTHRLAWSRTVPGPAKSSASPSPVRTDCGAAGSSARSRTWIVSG